MPHGVKKWCSALEERLTEQVVCGPRSCTIHVKDAQARRDPAEYMSAIILNGKNSGTRLYGHGTGGHRLQANSMESYVGICLGLLLHPLSPDLLNSSVIERITGVLSMQARIEDAERKTRPS